jgi:hypothetical protein
MPLLLVTPGKEQWWSMRVTQQNLVRLLGVKLSPTAANDATLNRSPKSQVLKLRFLIPSNSQQQNVHSLPTRPTHSSSLCAPMLSRAPLLRAYIRIPRTTRIIAPTPRIYTTTRPHRAMADTQAAAEATTSGVTPESISATLKSKLDASHVEVEDISGKFRQD